MLRRALHRRAKPVGSDVPGAVCGAVTIENTQFNASFTGVVTGAMKGEDYEQGNIQIAVCKIKRPCGN